MEPTSLTVPFVQEIAKEELKSVPERYVLPLHERPILSNTTPFPLPEIPVVDLSKLLSQDHKTNELEKLHFACKQWGFFQVTNDQNEGNYRKSHHTEKTESVPVQTCMSLLLYTRRSAILECAATIWISSPNNFNFKTFFSETLACGTCACRGGSSNNNVGRYTMLDTLCSNTGELLCSLINHGVSTSLLENVKIGTQEFFNLPMEEKKKFAQREGDVEGYGQLFVVSEDQKLQWGDVFFMFTLPPEKRKPHLLPNFPLSLRDALEIYSSEMKKLGIQILNLMANALKVDTKEITEVFETGNQAMRLNYYPPCPQPELVMGLNPHSDAGGITILLQANEVQGLQIKKDGHWIPVKPLSNAFIVNIGDVLEMITNGIYRSIEHRATVNSEKERLSIATFIMTSMESILGPAPTLITPETPALFRRISYGDYYRGFLSQELRGKSFLDNMRIN